MSHGRARQQALKAVREVDCRDGKFAAISKPYRTLVWLDGALDGSHNKIARLAQMIAAMGGLEWDWPQPSCPDCYNESFLPQ